VRVEVLTSLYPGSSRPFEGIFAERRWLGMSARGHGVAVVQPLPITPGPFRASWREIAGMARQEMRGPIEVLRPRYLHLPGRARYNARAFARKGASTILGRARPDVVVADYAWPAAAVAPLLQSHGIPLVVSGRGSDVLEVAGEAGLKEELAAYLGLASHWCAVSEDLLRAMDGLGGRLGRGHLVANGVDLETFRPGDRAQGRKRVGEALEGRLVVCCGHLIARKDPLLALEAFAAGAGPGDRMAFLGRGPLESALRERVAALGLAQRVRLVGEVKPVELAAWYAACNVLLLTSRREGRPNVVIEALACGRPVLATASGGTGELLQGCEERMLERGRDPEILGRKLGLLLESAPAADELRAMVEHLSWTASFEALERCLEEAVEGR
jgi:glycosyltransferase involved in cell wall biosynthesis